MANVLIVDDEASTIFTLKKILEKGNHSVTAVFDANSAIERVKQFKYDVLVTDFSMPDMNGIELTEKVLSLEPDMIVILVTAYDSIKNVVEAMRKGAYDYMTKPINAEELLLSIARGLEKVNLMNENLLLRQELEKKKESIEYDTSSEQVKALVQEARKIAETDSSVLITGANGTGKEVLAKFIHKNSKRHDKQFVVLNCAAIPSLLLESELFGHVKGAFTGAVKDHKGYFEIANNGTIFLDEIGELDPLLQIKLLRVIQEKEFSRVGDTKILKTDVRIIAATNRDLNQAIKEGKFREDLYYRLNVFEFRLPSLVERPEDILYYFEKFVKQFAEMHQKGDLKIDNDVKIALQKYSWPGNIRELKNVAERVTVLADRGVITTDLLPNSILNTAENNITDINDYNECKNKVIRQFEIDFITKHLKIHNGNVAATAKAINFHPVSLRQKIAKLGINPHKFKINN
ncbi:MAG: sigma-54 dependent transcriptional regulator [Ignavibacteria bacterium]|nr:sigma-54 dependent transcriptional regulator [Ignavibacteria bacterium]